MLSLPTTLGTQCLTCSIHLASAKPVKQIGLDVRRPEGVKFPAVVCVLAPWVVFCAFAFVPSLLDLLSP